MTPLWSLTLLFLEIPTQQHSKYIAVCLHPILCVTGVYFLFCYRKMQKNYNFAFEII